MIGHDDVVVPPQGLALCAVVVLAVLAVVLAPRLPEVIPRAEAQSSDAPGADRVAGISQERAVPDGMLLASAPLSDASGAGRANGLSAQPAAPDVMLLAAAPANDGTGADRVAGISEQPAAPDAILLAEAPASDASGAYRAIGSSEAPALPDVMLLAAAQTSDASGVDRAVGTSRGPAVPDAVLLAAAPVGDASGAERIAAMSEAPALPDVILLAAAQPSDASGFDRASGRDRSSGLERSATMMIAQDTSAQGVPRRRTRPGVDAEPAGPGDAPAIPEVPAAPPEAAPPAGADEPPARRVAPAPAPTLRRPGGEASDAPRVDVDDAAPRRPGVQVREAGPPQEPIADPNRASGLPRVDPTPADARGDFLPVPDRWRLASDLGLVKERWFDPYGPNILKGDRPFYKDWFFNLGVISDTTYEPRRLPTPVAPQVARRGGALDIFGGRDQALFNQNLILALVAYKGDTVFKPPDYEFRLTPVVNYNHTRVDELRVLNISPREGATREDAHVGLQEAFVDVHLRNVSDRYDFDSVRIGIQPFSTDFRGFLFQDNQFGVRLFGTRDNNIWQYNLAWFRRLEKDTNSGLNDIGQRLRDDDIFIANVYRQDFPTRGFTSQGTVVHNRNRENRALYYDNNGFLVRPASLGTERLRDYDVTYLGYNGDGRFGRLNLSVSAYYAFGTESSGTFVNRESQIRSWFAAAEASMDFDWVRVRASVLFARGDDDPFDNRSQGFDAIFENPVFAGADTSFWIRQAVPNIGGGGVTLSGRNGILNSLRSSKEQGQSNFTNPGLQLFGLGADFDVTPQLRVSANLNKLYFDNTAVLEVARNQGTIDPDIGVDASLALIYRPLFSQNIVLRLSGAALVPGKGFRSLYGDDTSYSILGNLMLAY